jgi:hypothetical protein
MIFNKECITSDEIKHCNYALWESRLSKYHIDSQYQVRVNLETRKKNGQNRTELAILSLPKDSDLLCVKWIPAAISMDKKNRYFTVSRSEVFKVVTMQEELLF